MIPLETGRLYEGIPEKLDEEAFRTLFSDGSFRIERIVSRGHASPPGFWYEQNRNEWVLLLRGAARLKFEGWAETLELRPGGYVNIPAGVRHRVAWTDPDETTVWLAVWF